MDNNKSMWKTVLITGNPPSKKKKESVSIDELNQRLLVNTSDLMRLLSCGRPKAVETGTEAGAKVMLESVLKPRNCVQSAKMVT